MTVIYVLIALSLSMAVGFLVAFLWAVRSGQYDDTHTPSMRMLFDDRRRSSVNGHRSDHPNVARNVPTDDRGPTTTSSSTTTSP